MRPWKLMAMLVLAVASVAGILPVPTAPASADTLVHEITMGGSVRVRDDEVLKRRRKTCTRELAARSDAQLPSRSTTVLRDTDNKCGGEVRVEFHLTAVLREDSAGRPSWCVHGVAELYEGTRDTSHDLDGSKALSRQCGVPGTTLVWDDVVRNTAEGRSDDWGDYRVEVQLF